MLYALLAILAIMIIYSIIKEKNIYNPILGFSCVWGLIACFNIMSLHGLYKASDRAIIILMIGIVSFFIGYTLSKIITQEKNNKIYEYKINNKIIYILLIIGIILVSLLSIKVITLLAQGVPYSKIRGMYYTYGGNPSLINNKTVFTIFDWMSSIVLSVSTIISVISIFYKKIDKKILLGTFLYVLLYVFSTSGRGIMLNIIMYIFILFGLNFKKMSNSSIKKIGISLLLLLILIFSLTFIRGIGKKDKSVSDTYSYFSISIPMFSYWIDYADQNNIKTYGLSTLYGANLIVEKTSKLVFNYKLPYSNKLFEIMNKPQATWVKMNDSKNYYNAYTTMFYSFYLDFRIPGVITISMIYSLIVGLIYNNIKKNKDNLKMISIYMLIYSGVIMSFIRWQFSGVSVIITLIILSLSFTKRRVIKKENESKNILVFGITDNPGGIESVIMNYYRNINKNLVNFEFLCNTQEVAYEEEIKKLGGKIYKIPQRSKRILKYYLAMKKFYQENSYKYDAIWVNICSLANIDYLIFAKKYGIKTRIIHCHNSKNMDSKFRGILHIINRVFIGKIATNYWSCADEASKWFYNKKIIEGNKYKLINNAIDLDKFKYNEKERHKYRKELKLENNFVIGNVGRLHFQKNQLFLLDIFKEIKKIKKDAKLVLIGQGEDESKIIKKAKDLKVDGSILMLGVRSDVNSLLNSFDIMVFPSLFEGLSLTLIESQANGLNVFVSNTCDEKTKLTDNYVIIDLDKSPKEWAKIITNYNYNKNRSSKEILKAIEEKGYSIKKESKKIEQFFMEV